MQYQRPSGREVKKILAELLLREPFAESLECIQRLDPRQAVSPLFGFFCSRDALQRWRAVTAMGGVVARLADQNMEFARVVMRRFMWNLNEESGGIGWGCPEAMGECMSRSERLADEYACMLISYLHPSRNYIEHPGLQEGLLWGIGRLARARPAAMTECVELILPFFESPEAALRGHAAWAAGFSGDDRFAPQLGKLLTDGSLFRLYRDERLVALNVAAAAGEALQALRTASMKKWRSR
jgi:hypothetical protein